MDLIYAFARTFAGIGLVVLLTRLNGLRTFSKMSGFDFALTLAIGSTLASIAMADKASTFWAAVVAMVMLYLFQAGLVRSRDKWDPVRDRLDNAPLMLVEDGRIMEKNLDRGHITRADLIAKLRAAGVFHLADVRAVVLETTGDVSVLQGKDRPDDMMLEGIRRE